MHKILYPTKQNAFAMLKNKIGKRNAIVITDEHLYRFYKNELEKFKLIIIKAGEESKCFETVHSILSRLLAFKADRETIIIGVGGGVITDITGFVASIFMRGISFGFVSTSVLGQVDACVGGKNAINFYDYKNLIGNFAEPEFAIIATDLLKTLPASEMVNGFAEIIKNALIADDDLYHLLRNENFETIEIMDVVKKSIKIKTRFVSQDFYDKGVRKMLNFGHTIGHAIEKIAKESHGVSIAIGMMKAAELSHHFGFLKENDVQDIKNLLQQYRLPLKTDLSWNQIFDVVIYDKKRNSDRIDFILLHSIGKAFVYNLKMHELKSTMEKIW